MGAEVAGTTLADASLGFLLAGKEGAIVGAGHGAFKASIKRVTQSTLTDIAERTLSNREQVRIGAAASYSIKRINQCLENGMEPRTDILTVKSTSRIDAEEALEGILLKVKEEHEERKLKYIANMYPQFLFNKSITLSEFNFRLNLADGLTFNQICLLALLGQKEVNKEIILRSEDYVHGEKDNNLRATLNEVYDLYNKGLVQYFKTSDNRAYSLSGILSIIPNEMKLTEHGKRQFDLMSLSELEKSELIDVWAQLT